MRKKTKSFALALRLRARAATLLIALLCGVTGAWAWTNGAMNGQFSVSSTKKVVFSQGNLKYNGSTYSFATNQYDYIGASQADDNKDLFNWQTANSSVSVGGTTGWSVLTKDEWTYLLGRNSSSLRTKATVNSVKGLILMPDGWTAGSVSLTPNTSDFTTNTISTSQWATLEAEGCVFLPAAGKNDGGGVDDVNNACFYWTSTESGGDAYFLICSASEIYANYIRNKGRQLAVRLVRSPKAVTYGGGTGTSVDPYQISSTTDWNNLVSAVNGGETYSGTYFKMTANVGDVTPVSTWMTGTFSGTFDGYGKTLTVGYSTSARYCAPFGTLGGTVKNLRVAGTVSTSDKNFGGIAAQVTSGKTATIQNCRVSATFTSTLSGDNSSASFVGVVWNGGTLNITGCAFTGSLTGSGNAFGGFLGYKEGTCSVTNSLFAPASVTVSTEHAGTFSRPSAPTITNCYFTRTFGGAQGMQARTIVKGDYVSTLSVTKGEATVTYDVSGITVYSGGIDFNDGSTTTFYGGSGQSVSLALTAETRSGYQFKQYVASQGSLSGQTTDTPTLTMPAANSTANDAVTISAEYDPTYNATFADASDASNGWSISPTSGIVGSTVTVSYEGENKVKSVTVAPKGALTGKFSVSSTSQVQFSKGNLQAVFASAGTSCTWQFADHQYDYVGNTAANTAVNGNGSVSAAGTVDLFGWSTSATYYGINPSTDPNSYLGDFVDWGENSISNGCTDWRTLSSTEWNYLITGRTNAANLRTFATVNGVTGLIIMPDGWTASGVTLTITTANYTTNALSTSQWATLEKQGCVFLPAAGGRIGTGVVNVGSIGDYWSSDETHAYDLNFSNNNLVPQYTGGQRHYGWSVRLVRDVE